MKRKSEHKRFVQKVASALFTIFACCAMLFGVRAWADSSVPSGSEGANEWQVMKQSYAHPEGNGHSDEYDWEYTSDYSARYVKQVESTDVENEFIVHLTIQPEQSSMESFWDKATFGAVHNNSAALGGGVNTNSGWTVLHFVSEWEAAHRPGAWAEVRIKVLFNGEYYEQTRYVDTTAISGVKNGNVGLWSTDTNFDRNGNGRVDSQEPIALGGKGSVHWDGFSTSSVNNLDLSAIDLAQYITISSFASIEEGVTDSMGAGIVYLGEAIVSDGAITEEPTVGQSGTLSWDFTNATPCSGSTTTVTVGGAEHQYYDNGYTLSYKIKLDDYASCGLKTEDSEPADSGMVPTNGDTVLLHRVDETKIGKEAWEATNHQSYEMTIAGDSQEDAFTVPEVRGLLYELKLLKTDEFEEPLEGAEFKITDEAGNPVINADGVQVANVPSDEDGIVDFPNLMPGTYVVTEVSAPDGYAIAKDASGNSWSKTFTLNYTDSTSRALLSPQGSGEEALLDDTDTPIKNPKVRLGLYKEDTKEDPIAGAVFMLEGTTATGEYYADAVTTSDGGTAGTLATEEGFAWFEGIPDGSYSLYESSVPQPYSKSQESITVTVQDGVVYYDTTGTSDFWVHDDVVDPPIDGKQVEGTFGVVGVTNKFAPSLMVVKIDSDSSPIENAQFTLAFTSDGTRDTQTTLIDSSVTDVGSYHCDTGLSVARFDQLAEGAYTIDETRVPSGYNSVMGTHAITVNAAGEVLYDDTVCSTVDIDGTSYYYIVVINQEMEPLPVTGVSASLAKPLMAYAAIFLFIMLVLVGETIALLRQPKPMPMGRHAAR